MRCLIAISLLASLLINHTDANSQKYPFVNYTPADGLVNNRCRYMLQDSRGRLYITTFRGLSIYDGARFTNYSSDNGLAIGLVNDVVEMARDSIWVLPNVNRIQCLVNGKLKDIITADGFYPVVNKLIKCSDGFYYALADDGLFRFKDNRFMRMHLKDKKGKELNNYFVKGVEIKGKLFIITDPTTNNTLAASRLVIFDLKSSETIISDKPPDISYILETPQGEILVATGNGLRTLNQKALLNGSLRFDPVPSKFKSTEKITPGHMFFDRQQNCWLSTLDGVYRLDRGGDLKLFNVENGLPVNSISSVFQDNENIMWFLNTETGISKLSSINFQSFSQLQPGFNAFDVFTNEHTDSIWALDAAQNKILLFSKNQWQQFTIQSDSSIQYVSIVGNSDQGWLSSPYRISKFSISPNRKAIITQEVYSIPRSSTTGIRYLLTDKKGNIVFSRDNINVITGTNKITSYPLLGLADQFVFAGEKQLWIVTRGATFYLFRIHPDDTERYFELIKSYDKELPILSPRSVTVDQDDNLWVGSREHGLFRFSFDKKWNIISWDNITAKNGLSDNFITFLHCDPDNNVWACTPAGLDKIRVINNKMVIENISRANNIYTYISKIQTDKKGIHWVRTNAGVIKIEPQESLTKKFDPKIFFSQIQAGKDTVVNSGKKITLSYKQNHLNFQLSAPSFINEKQTLYSFRLHGSLNNNWSDPSSNSDIRFINLAPGDYALEVKASFPSGIYAGSNDIFHFEILPPWWQTWWFRILLITVAVTITAIFVRAYFRRKIEKQRILLEQKHLIEQERRRIADEMHDDLGAGLSTIRFLSEKVKRDNDNVNTATDLNKIVVNSNDLVQKINEIIWAMNEKNDTLEDLVFYTRAYAMEYCEDNNISCKVILPEDIPHKSVNGEIRRNVFLTIKESLHNVVKHAEARLVVLQFRIDNHLYVTIQDNGKGINMEYDKKRTASGNGLINMQKRINLLGGTIIIQSSNGVTVEFSIPLEPEHFP